MEDGLEKQLSRSEMQKQRAFDIAIALREANIIIPQTYGATRVYGALSMFEACTDSNDFTLEEIFEALSDNKEQIIDMFVEAMESSHQPHNIIPKSKGVPIDAADITKRVGELLNSHAEVSLTSMADMMRVIELSADYKEGNAFQHNRMAVGFLTEVKEALLDERMREEIKRYRTGVAKDRSEKWRLASDLTNQWKQVFFDRIDVSDETFKFLDNDREKIADLFVTVTDPSYRTLADDDEPVDEED